MVIHTGQGHNVGSGYAFVVTCIFALFIVHYYAAFCANTSTIIYLVTPAQ